MFLKVSKITSAAAIAATVAIIATTTSADARDWLRTMDKHDRAAQETRFTPHGANPQWGFSLQAVVDDMAWRQRTARILRQMPRPSADPDLRRPGQVAEESAPALRFAF